MHLIFALYIVCRLCIHRHFRHSAMDNDLLYRYFSHNTTPEEDSIVRHWVESSDENYNRFLAERKFFDTAMLMASEPYEGVQTSARRHNGFRRTLTRWAFRSAAAAAIAILAIVGYRSVVTGHDHFSQPMIQTLHVPAGQRLQVQLADGTSVWLNSNTRLSFPKSFADSKTRCVNIDGEAYFHVAKDADHPFVVNTPNGNITVTGTTFNVDSYSGSGYFSVSLLEGGVNVESDGHSYRLTPGRRIAFADGHIYNGELRSEDLEWINGIVSFRNLQLSGILKRFEKYYGVSIDFQCGDEIASTQFSGKFYLDEGIEQALNALSRDVKFVYEFDKESRSVVIH